MAPPERPLRDLTAGEVERFVRECVIHVSGVLSPRWVQRLADAVDSQTRATGLQSMKANAWHTDEQMHRIIMNCPVAHLAQQALNGLSPASDREPGGELKPVRFFYDQMFVKHPHTEDTEDGAGPLTDAQGHLGNTPWHHDITFWPVIGDQIVSIWIALDRTNLHNGALEFVPGSSSFDDRFQAVGVGNEGRLPFSSDRLKALPAINSATTGETDGDLTAISFDMEAGDVLIFDATILHGAPPNLSSRPRRGLALRYLGSDVVFDDDKYGERTSMAPFDCYDESRSNGDQVAGYAYPQVLPHKIRAEVEARLEGPIIPSRAKMQRWRSRAEAASTAASTGQELR
ncbi:MAG: phytanoyl-CoA dioxygenase family protein [Acidimicrobiia bacterium]|nr:phytanoyl-CoA dioxygenase family protein [Acidimicrobiia bacterium]